MHEFSRHGMRNTWDLTRWSGRQLRQRLSADVAQHVRLSVLSARDVFSAPPFCSPPRSSCSPSCSSYLLPPCLLRVEYSHHHVVLQQQPESPASATPCADTSCLHPRTAVDPGLAAGLPAIYEFTARPTTLTATILAAGARPRCRICRPLPAHGFATAAPRAWPDARTHTAHRTRRLLRVGYQRRDGAVWYAARPERGRSRPGLRTEERARPSDML